MTLLGGDKNSPHVPDEHYTADDYEGHTRTHGSHNHDDHHALLVRVSGLQGDRVAWIGARIRRPAWDVAQTQCFRVGTRFVQLL